MYRAAKRRRKSTLVTFVRTHPNLVFLWYKRRNFRAIRRRLPISRIRIFLFLSYSFGIETIKTFTNTRSSPENHTRFQTLIMGSSWQSVNPFSDQNAPTNCIRGISAVGNWTRYFKKWPWRNSDSWEKSNFVWQRKQNSWSPLELFVHHDVFPAARSFKEPGNEVTCSNAVMTSFLIEILLHVFRKELCLI